MSTANETPLLALEQTLRSEFELADATGNLVTHRGFRGEYLLLSIGFTHCDYICPTIAAKMEKAMQLSEPSVSGIFVSLDTERDTPVITHRYANAFHENMMGRSGNYKQIAEAAENFKLTYVVTKSSDSYVVQHSATIYPINPEGEIQEVFALNAAPDEIANSINSAAENDFRHP